METSFAVRVYVGATDLTGVVYHANYLHYFEQARVEHLRARGFELGKLIVDNEFLFVVQKITINYIKSAKLDDELIVKTAIVKCKRASMLYEQKIILAKDERMLCQADIKVASVTNDIRPVALPLALRQEFGSG